MRRANRYFVPGFVDTSPIVATSEISPEAGPESIAVGSEEFIEQVKIELGLRAQHRQLAVADGLYTLREPVPAYGDHFDRGNEVLKANKHRTLAKKP
jgi:hypothetical protein